MNAPAPAVEMTGKPGLSSAVENLDALFADLVSDDHLLVAVSGGSDSIALLHLLDRWVKERDKPDISVITIDHRLRKESAAEADYVSLVSSGLGLRHITRRWEGSKPESGISSKARAVRYQLLSQAALEIGATRIVLGHTLDDQRETILMRAERVGYSDFKSPHDAVQAWGLGGMQKCSYYKGPPDYQTVGLRRPLLDITRNTLREFLKSQNIDWCDDPGNEDEKYERIRLRHALIARPHDFPTVGEIAAFAARMQKERERLCDQCAELIEQVVSVQPGGVFSIDRMPFERVPQDVAILILRCLVAVVGGGRYLVPVSKVEKLLHQRRRGNFKRFTLGSVVVACETERIIVWREARNLAKIPVTNPDGGAFCWDGRIVYRFDVAARCQDFVMAPLGLEGLRQVEGQNVQKSTGKTGAALCTQPALFQDCKPVLLPFGPQTGSENTAIQVECWTPALELFSAQSDMRLVASVRKLHQRALQCLGIMPE